MVKVTANHKSITSEFIEDIQVMRYQGMAPSGDSGSPLNYYFILEPTADISISYHGQDELPSHKQLIRTILTSG